MNKQTRAVQEAVKLNDHFLFVFGMNATKKKIAEDKQLISSVNFCLLYLWARS